MKFCVDRCRFQKWKKGTFRCDLHEEDLKYLKVGEETFNLLRCRQCQEDTEEFEKIKEYDKKNENI